MTSSLVGSLSALLAMVPKKAQTNVNSRSELWTHEKTKTLKTRAAPITIPASVQISGLSTCIRKVCADTTRPIPIVYIFI